MNRCRYGCELPKQGEVSRSDTLRTRDRAVLGLLSFTALRFPVWQILNWKFNGFVRAQMAENVIDLLHH
jgi:hypothetical protein